MLLPLAGTITALVCLFAMSCVADAPTSFDAERERMVARQIESRGVNDPLVLHAMRTVPRHLFVPESQHDRAYDDTPIHIGHGQTISQPYIVAIMTEALELAPNDRVLEIGTGSGYQTAVLAEIIAEVYSIEIVPELAERAKAALTDPGNEGIHLLTGDGYRGWPEHAPFDGIIVTCAPENIPKALTDQLAEGGRMVIPVGGSGDVQELVRIRKQNGELHREKLLPVRFVPMIHGHE